MGHPNKEIRKAIEYGESRGWRLELSDGHAYGRLYCPESSREGHVLSVWSTPKDPFSHARRIRKFVDSCEHSAGEDDG